MPRATSAVLSSLQFSCEGLEVMRLAAIERIGQLGEAEVELCAPLDAKLNGPDLIGAEVAIALGAGGRRDRVFAGIVAEASDALDASSELRMLRLRVVPPQFRLALTKLQQITHGSVAEVIEHKLKQCGVGCELRLRESYPARDYVAQFAETDLAFVSRLAEYHGVSFFVRGDQLVFTDHNGGFEASDLAIGFQRRGDRIDVYRLEARARMIPSLYVVSDYNYRGPQFEIEGEAQAPNGSGGGVIEYGVHVRSGQEAQFFARVRAEEQACRQLEFAGESDRPELCAGMRFKLEGHPILGDRDLLVVSAEHTIEQAAKGVSRGELAYSNRFVAFDCSDPGAPSYRPARVTPVPKIGGLVSGVVLAQPGAKPGVPWLDEQGRYRIQLMFDVLGAGDEDKPSRPMRMIQAHAGPGYGVHFPLRPGIEVMLAFVNGDVDRPIIVGAAPNTVTPSPVTASEALRHRIRTHSGVLVEIEDGH